MNRRTAATLALSFAASLGAFAQLEEGFLWSFDRDPVGKVPPRFGAADGWAVAADPGAPTRPNVLVADASSSTNALGSICAVEKIQMEAGQVWTRCNVQSGGAGVVFRLRTPDTFCALTVTPENNRLQLIAVRGGVAQELATCALKTTFGRWHRIGVELDGRNIHCSFDGTVKFIAQDDLLNYGKGRVGLIVSRGGRAQFDDVTLEPAALPESAPHPETTVEVIITREKFFLGETAMTVPELTEALTKKFQKDQRLLIRPDRDVEFERVEQIMKAAGSIGFEKLSIDLRK